MALPTQEQSSESGASTSESSSNINSRIGLNSSTQTPHHHHDAFASFSTVPTLRELKKTIEVTVASVAPSGGDRNSILGKAKASLPDKQPSENSTVTTDSPNINTAHCNEPGAPKTLAPRESIPSPVSSEVSLRQVVWKVLWRQQQAVSGDEVLKDSHDGPIPVNAPDGLLSKVSPPSSTTGHRPATRSTGRRCAENHCDFRSDASSDWDPELEIGGNRTPKFQPTVSNGLPGDSPGDDTGDRPKRDNRMRARRKDWERATIWATRGSIRCFILGFTLRSGVNVLLTFFKILKKGKLRRFHKALWGALFAQNSLRMASMLSIFTGLYRFSKAAFRLLRTDPEEEKHWDAAIAGAVASLAILAEVKENRLAIAQQIFIRGSQGLVNVAKFKGVRLPRHGDVVLFGLACGQIMYAWLVQPEHLEPGYRKWIIDASQSPAAFGYLNSGKIRNGIFDIAKAEKILDVRGLTPSNKTALETMLDHARHGDFGPPVLPCNLIAHPAHNSCRTGLASHFLRTFKWIAPVYATLHFVPSVLFKPKAFTKHPAAFLQRAAVGVLRSCAFLSTFVYIITGSYCLRFNILNDEKREWFPQILRKVLMSGGYFWMAGFMTSLALFWEHKKRRAELAMYVIPKALESLWSIARRKSLVPYSIPGGEVLLTACSLSVVMSCYTHHPERLSRLVRQLLYQLVGTA